MKVIYLILCLLSMAAVVDGQLLALLCTVLFAYLFLEEQNKEERELRQIFLDNDLYERSYL